MPLFAALEDKKREHVRKAKRGICFVAPGNADPIEAITQYTAGPPAVIDLAPLPTHTVATEEVPWYEDLGWLTTDGMAFSRDVSTSAITAFGATSPVRTDVTADTSTLTVAALETKLLTIGLATGAELAGIVPDSQTGEVRIDKPITPDSKTYRVLNLALDKTVDGEIYIGRYLPAARVTSYAAQNYGGGDGGLTWGVTFTGEEDSDLGATESYFFGGAGWNALLESMGFEVP